MKVHHGEKGGSADNVVINFLCVVSELCFAKRAYDGNIGE
jgi:hypothetical protein